MKKQATTKTVKTAAAKTVKKATKKVNLAEVGKKKPGRKPKDEVVKKKADLTKVGTKKPGRKPKEEKVAAPKKEKAGLLNAYEFAEKLIAEKKMKRPTDAAARKLVIGDVIEVFYNDQKKGVLEIVVKSARRGEDIYNVATVTEGEWGARVEKMSQVNSDLWRKVGSVQLKIKMD